MARNTDDIDDPPRKPVMFMGRNIEEIPCFRQVLITGILSGLGIGFGTFMLTSLGEPQTQPCIRSSALRCPTGFTVGTSTPYRTSSYESCSRRSRAPLLNEAVTRSQTSQYQN
ncbi:uncharacterized protein l(3)87Df isoform X2 [Dermacentor andersoni]|uniref:uncharacterized protein l(3)87Df isoform X2 n=1 Tax=Dermacentor andersoni TaxID=34620 RepID=UPI002416345A|nr:uncharacterized protein LOC126544552 isoform X2 [Dermacentor andersoni]